MTIRSERGKMAVVVTALMASLLLQESGLGQDKLMFNSGRVVSCEILDYANGMFSVRLEDGSLNRAPVNNVKRIHFATLPPSKATEAAPEQADSTLDSSASPGSPDQIGEYTFRETRWGMSKEEVIAIEGPPAHEAEDSLTYETTLAGLKAGIVYTFVDGLLAQGGYVFMESHYENNDYIYDYSKINAYLSIKYGKPSEEGHIWYNKLFQKKQDDWGLALRLGYHSYLTLWQAGNTGIIHSLQGQDHKIVHLIQYQEKDIYERGRKNNLDSVLDSL